MLSLKLQNLAYLTNDNVPRFFGNRYAILNVYISGTKNYQGSLCSKHVVLTVSWRREVIDIEQTLQG